MGQSIRGREGCRRLGEDRSEPRAVVTRVRGTTHGGERSWPTPAPTWSLCRQLRPTRLHPLSEVASTDRQDAHSVLGAPSCEPAYLTAEQVAELVQVDEKT